LKIVIAENAGFCFGVGRAVEIVLTEADKEGSVCTLGQIIHNPVVVEELAEKGVRVVETLDEVMPGERLVIRSHGVALSTYEELERRCITYRDATCPYVANIHKIVSSVDENGTVIVAGDPAHPETIGIMGHCKAVCYVVENEERLLELAAVLEDSTKTRCVLVAQTTYNLQQWNKIIESAKKVCTNIEIFDTICKATFARQNEALKLSKTVDAMIVVGGKNSSNTTKLYHICSENCPTVRIERAAELANHKDLFAGADLIGITAGASTPACIIKEVHDSMSNLENINNEMTFEEMLNETFKSTYNGEKVKAVVIGIKPNEISVDIGTKHAAYVPLHELSDDVNAKPEDIVKIGDEIELLVVRVNDVEGTVMLSKRRLDAAAGFEKVMNAGETGEILKGTVTEVIKGGVLALTSGVKVFIPASQTGVPRDGNLETLLRKEVTFKILETNRQRRRAVGSISVVAREQRKELAKKFWEEVAPGKVYTGKVKSITNFGVFVDLGGVDGRIGLSDLTWLRAKHPSDIVAVGDTVEVTVKDVDAENGKVSLIYKKSEDNPWEIIKTKYAVGDVLTVKIMSTTLFGAFAQIIPGIDGLIHISQIAKERVEKVTDKLKVGDEVEAKITELDYEKKRASLSIKALLPDDEPAAPEAAEAPAEEAAEAPAEEAAE